MYNIINSKYNHPWINVIFLFDKHNITLIPPKSEFSSNLLWLARGIITHDSICHFSVLFSTYECILGKNIFVLYSDMKMGSKMIPKYTKYEKNPMSDETGPTLQMCILCCC